MASVVVPPETASWGRSSVQVKVESLACSSTVERVPSASKKKYCRWVRAKAIGRKDFIMVGGCKRGLWTHYMCLVCRDVSGSCSDRVSYTCTCGMRYLCHK